MIVLLLFGSVFRCKSNAWVQISIEPSKHVFEHAPIDGSPNAAGRRPSDFRIDPQRPDQEARHDAIAPIDLLCAVAPFGAETVNTEKMADAKTTTNFGLADLPRSINTVLGFMTAAEILERNAMRTTRATPPPW